MSDEQPITHDLHAALRAIDDYLRLALEHDDAVPEPERGYLRAARRLSEALLQRPGGPAGDAATLPNAA